MSTALMSDAEIKALCDDLKDWAHHPTGRNPANAPCAEAAYALSSEHEARKAAERVAELGDRDDYINRLLTRNSHSEDAAREYYRRATAAEARATAAEAEVERLTGALRSARKVVQAQHDAISWCPAAAEPFAKYLSEIDAALSPAPAGGEPGVGQTNPTTQNGEKP